MVQITLTEEQARVLQHALVEPVQICDPQGKILRTIEPEYSKEFIAELKRRAAAPGSRYTGKQVRQHLDALQKAWDREGPFEEKRLHDLLAELRANDEK